MLLLYTNIPVTCLLQKLNSKFYLHKLLQSSEPYSEPRVTAKEGTSLMKIKLSINDNTVF